MYFPKYSELGSQYTEPGNLWLGGIYYYGLICSQDVCEVQYVGAGIHSRISQSAYELLYAGNPHLDVTQAVAELLYKKQPDIRGTQSVAETVYRGVPSLRNSQSVIELCTHVTTNQAQISQSIVELWTSVSSGGLSARASQSIAELLYVDVANTNRYVTSGVQVTQTIGLQFNRAKNVTSNISVTPTITERDTGVRITVTDTVHVTSTVTRAGSNNQSLTSSVTVTSTPSGRNDHIRLIVQSSGTVTSSASGVSRSVSKTVTSTINCGHTVFGRDDTSRQSITSAITVTDTIVERDDTIRQSISSPITVSWSITENTGVHSRSVSDSGTVSQTIGVFIEPAGGRNISISVTDNINVTNTPFGRNNHVRLNVSSIIGVSDAENERDTTIRLPVQTSAHAGQTIDFLNSNNRQSVISTVHVTTAQVNTDLKFTITDNLTVGQTISTRSTFVFISVTDNVTVPQFNPRPVAFDITPVRISIGDTITVTDSVTGGSTGRPETVHDIVTVLSSLVTNQINVAVTDNITVASTLRRNNVANSQTVVDIVTTNDFTIARSNVIHKTVVNSIAAVLSYGVKTPIVVEGVADAVHPSQTISTRTVPIEKLTDAISVSSVVLYHTSPSRQLVNDSITVTTSQRFSPVRITVTDSIATSSATNIPVLIVHDRITVSDAANITHILHILDELDFTEQVVSPLHHVQVVIQELDFLENLARQVNYIRTVNDQLILPDRDILRPVSISPYPIIVPVATGTLIMPTVTLQANGMIVLPAPLFGDTDGNVQSVDVKRTMTGLTYTFVKSSDRRRLKYIFRVFRSKYFEFRNWIMTNLSQQITMTNFKGEQWIGFIVNNPIEMTNHADTISELIEFEIDFEGVKISG